LIFAVVAVSVVIPHFKWMQLRYSYDTLFESRQFPAAGVAAILSVVMLGSAIGFFVSQCRAGRSLLSLPSRVWGVLLAIAAGGMALAELWYTAIIHGWL